MNFRDHCQRDEAMVRVNCIASLTDTTSRSKVVVSLGCPFLHPCFLPPPHLELFPGNSFWVGKLIAFCFLFVCFLNLRYNWHVTSRKFKIYTVDRILMYCNVIITVALADTFVMSHHCHFGGEAHCFEDILLWKSFFLSGWFYFTFF